MARGIGWQLSNLKVRRALELKVIVGFFSKSKQPRIGGQAKFNGARREGFKVAAQ